MPRRNELYNPSWEAGLGRWAAAIPGGTLAAIYARETGPYTPVPSGSYYAYANRQSAGRLNVYPYLFTPVTAGLPYSASIYINRDGTGSAVLDIDWYSGNGTGYLSSSSATLNPAVGTWARISVVGTAPAGATYARMFLHFDNMLTNTYIRFDAALFEQRSSTGTYFDGSFAGFEWEGAAGDSPSVEITNTAPVANAGADQTGKTYGSTVNLSGSATDAQGGTLSYAWTVQNANGSGLTNASLTNRLTSTATFQVPAVGANTTVTFRLTVTDSEGLSDTDDMTVQLLAVDARSGTGWAKVGLSARGSGVKRGVGAGYSARVGLSARASGTRKAIGSGLARHGLTTTGTGSKRAQGAGQARFGLSGRAAGVKRAWGTAQSAAIGFTSRAAGLKRGIGTGLDRIGLTAWAVTPPPVPVFTGRPLSEDPLPLASSRYLVQNILTGDWLHQDLPLAEDMVTLTLSGPCEITGKVRPELADLKAPDGSPLLRSWGHVVYLEMDGEIRAAGLITEDSYDDQTQTLVCQGVSAYPSVIAFQDKYRRYFANPLDVVAQMWGYVQGFQNGNLGVAVERLGERPAVLYGASVDPVPGDQLLGYDYAPRPENDDDDPPIVPVARKNTLAPVWNQLRTMGYAPQPFKAEDGSTVNANFYGEQGQRIFVRKADLERAYTDHFLAAPTQTFPDPPDLTSSVTIDPFKVDWWDVKGVGDIVNEAVKACPADYVEQYRWNTPKSFVLQTVTVAYPRLGRRRDDLRFVQGENITSAPGLTSDPDSYATAVIGIGAGEGSSALRETAEVVTPGRIRKTYTYRNTSITDRATLRRIVADELRQRSTGGYEVSSVVVQASHVNARFGAYIVGDDILVQVFVPHFGWVQQWGRITSMTLARGADLVELKLRRSDSFFYGREVEQT